MATKKKSTKKKSSSGVKAFIIKRKKVLKWTLVAIGILGFATFGAYMTMRSDAATIISGEQCILRGRQIVPGVRTDNKVQCAYSCQKGAGKFIVPKGKLGYCTNAISPSVSEASCKANQRRYIGKTGCTRRWQQNQAKKAIQCLNRAYTYYVASTDYCSDPNWVWPVPGTKSLGVSPWGSTNSHGVHKGIDIGISGGRSLGYRVVAAHAGVVTKSYNSGACGWFMVIKATGTPYWQAYQHLSPSTVKVRPGSKVRAGQDIGTIGTAGGSSCGSSGFYHLHFSIEKFNGISFYSSPLSNTINPLSVLPR